MFLPQPYLGITSKIQVDFCLFQVSISKFDLILKISLGSWNVQRAACAQLSCQPGQLSERIEKMSLNLRQSQKELKNLTREIADFSAQELIREIGNEKLLKLHRKDVGPDFLTSAAEKLKHLVADGVTIALSCGEQKKGGNVVILGEKDKLDKVSKEILSLLDGRGAAKNGRIQAKITNVKNIEKVYELLK